MLRAPRYDARPFRACIGIVERMPSSAAARARAPASSAASARAQPTCERAERRRVGVDDRLVAHRRRPEPLDLLEPGPQRRQQILRVEGLGVTEGPVPSAGTPSRTGVPPLHPRTGPACFPRSPGSGRFRRRRGVELGDRGEEASIHVHAVVGVPDGGVELGEVVPLVMHALGRAPDPPPARTGVRTPVRHSPMHPTRHRQPCSTIPNDPPRFRGGYGDAQDLTQQHRTEL